MSNELRRHFSVNLRTGHVPEPGDSVPGTGGRWEYDSISVKAAAGGVYATVTATYRLASDSRARAPASSSEPVAGCIRPDVENMNDGELREMVKNRV